MTKKTQPRRVIRSIFLLTFSELLLQGLYLLYRMVLARMLTPEQMGLYGLMMPVYGFLSAAVLSGFSFAASRTTADYAGKPEDHPVRAGRVLRQTLLACLPVFCTAGILFSPLSGFLAERLGRRELQPALLLFLPCLLMTSFENIVKSVFQGMEDVLPSMISECSEQLVRIGAVALLLSFCPDDGGRICAAIVLGMIASEAVSDGILWHFARRLPAGQTAVPDDGLVREIRRTALPVCTANACGMLLSALAGAILPAALEKYGYGGGAALAVYGELTGVLLPILTIPGAFVYPVYTVMLPRLTAAAASGNRRLFFRRGVQTLLAGGLAAACTGGGTVLLLPVLAEGFFDTPCPAGSGSLLLLGAAQLFGYLTAGLCCILNGAGKQGMTAGLHILLGGAELPALYGLSAAFGLRGYAVFCFGSGLVQLLTFSGAVCCLWKKSEKTS